MQAQARSRLVLAIAVALAGPAVHAATAESAAVALAAAVPADVPGAPQTAQKLGAINVIATRLDQARNQLSPSTGSSSYTFGPQAISQLPLGASTPVNQILLQAPGVVQDSYGEVHVRGDHGNLQYRINGVLIPESISGFGQTLDPRMIESMRLLTGALPAQYGLRTAGVVDVTTRSGEKLGNGGSVGLTMGSHATLVPTLSGWGSAGRWSWFATGSFSRNDLGIENPTPARNAIHDRSNQIHGFGMLSYLLNDEARVSLMAGLANNRFQIPDNPGQLPVFALVAAPPGFDSAQLDERQRELTRFAVLSLQGKLGATRYQVALGQRYSQVDFQPDNIGDLIFNGVASTVGRSNRASTLQADFAIPLGDTHTLRYGAYASDERAAQDNTSLVFPVDANGVQTSDVPLGITDNNRLRARTLSLYLQDEWTPGERLAINYGLRYDHIGGYLDESQLSPRLGAVYNLSDAWTLHAGYARYFTPPSTELIAATDIALFQGTSNALPTSANTSVRAARSNDYDIGVQWQINPALTLGLDAYYTQSRNLLDEGQFGTALIFSDFNYRYGRDHGIEFSATYAAGPWNAYFNLTGNTAKGKQVASGQYNFDTAELTYIAQNWIYLDHAQRVSSSGGVSFRFEGGTRIGADFLYGTGLHAGFANTQNLPAYFQLNLNIRHRFDLGPLGPVKTRFTVLNALDRSYALRDGTGIGVGAPQYAPRRGYYVTVERDF
jgi:outer membrane receptor protein involved in Fe transport